VASPWTSRNCVEWRHGVEQNAELRRQVQGQDRLLSRRELDRVDHDFLEQPLVCVVLGKVDA